MSESASYKQERLQKQIEWHSEKARDNKIRFHIYQIITLIASTIIPIINVASIGDFQTRLISSITAGIIAVATGLTQLEKYQENWILYRASSELLKKEKYFFENSVGEYSDLDDTQKNKLLVERIESIVSAETSKYFTIHQPSQRQPHGNEKTSQK